MSPPQITPGATSAVAGGDGSGDAAGFGDAKWRLLRPPPTTDGGGGTAAGPRLQRRHHHRRPLRQGQGRQRRSRQLSKITAGEEA